ncbi:MarC family protein [Pseudoxanthobacter sp.]|uniref:MarC family protein n=1 Tax=Pseudoxanthobacter sp. TaxID=1925742 RepID=UPI002FE0EE7D
MHGSYQQYLLGILAVANNIPALAPFLAMCGGLSRVQTLRLVVIATATSLIVMLMSMVFGTAVLAFFGISISAFQIAGGLLLCSTGHSMLNARTSEDVSTKAVLHPDEGYRQRISATVVPVAIPLTTGAGTMSTVTVFAQLADTNNTHLLLLFAILTMTVIIFLVFYFAVDLTRFIGEVGMSVLVKVMGLFTLAIGVQFVVTGVTTIYAGLPHA